MKLKKILAVILLFTILLGALPLNTLTVSAATSGYFTYTVENGEATITDCNTSISGDITIPSTLGGYPVTSIGRCAFHSCNLLTSITIPGRITFIGEETFYNCSSLKSVTIPDSVTSISVRAFGWCSSLTSVTIPNSVTSIGEWAFSGCSSLTSVTIPNRVTSIGSYAFGWCSSLTSVTIPDSVTSIGDGAFCRCSSLTSVNIPYSVTSIGDYAFSNCGSLTSIFVNGNNTIYSSINGVLFNKYKTSLICYPGGKSDISTYIIPNSVTSIGKVAFSECSSLKSVTIPDSVTSIGNSAFAGCSSLIYISIPDSVTSIEGWAFSGCSLLTSITISGSITFISDGTFYGCSSLKSVTIPDSVTSIGNWVFDGCSSLTSITIPNSVKSIGRNAFYDCPNLVINAPYNSYAANWAIENNIPVRYYKSGTIVTVMPTGINASFIAYGTGRSISGVKASYSDKRLIASTEGYYGVNIANCTLNSENMKKLALVPQSTGAYISAVHANGTDILSSELVTKNANNAVVTINVYAAEGVNVLKYQLLQKTTVIAESLDGSFEFSSDKMPVSADYYVRIVDTSGKTYKKLKINYENKSFAEVEYELDEFFKFTVPDNIPLIGGKEFELTLSDLPINTKVENNSVYITIGTEYDFIDEEFNFASYKNFVDETLKDINKGFSMYKMSSEYGDGRKWKLWNGNATTGLKGSVKIKFFGYCELQYDTDGKLRLKASNTAIAISGSVGGEWQTAVGPVPVVVKVKGSIETETKVTIGFSNTNKLFADGSVSFTLPNITASAGVGITKVADVSVYGSASNVIDINFSPPQTTATLSGELGISAKALFWEGKLKLLNGDWQYYNSLKANTYSAAAYSLRSEISREITNEENYSIDRSHLQTQSEWLSEPKAARTFSLLRNAENDYSVTSITKLQSDIYNGASPKVVTLEDGRRIMVWTADIAERNNYNHTAAVYSVYTPQTEYWSEPQIISDDLTADFTPQIATDGINTYAVWSNSSAVFDSEVSMDEVAAACEITYAKFDVENGTFSEAVTLTNDNLYDYNPNIFVNNGKCYICWVKNNGNSPITLEGTNDVYYAIIDETSEISIAASNSVPVSEAKIGKLGNSIVLSFATDSDGDFATTNDTVLYASTLGESPSVISETAEQGNIVFAEISGKNKLLYYKNNSLCSYSDFGLEEVLISDFASAEFDVVSSDTQTAVICSMTNTESETDGADLYAYLYGENGFSNPVSITQNYDTYVKGANGYIDENGNICVVFLQKSADFSGDEPVVHTDLYDAKIVPDFDIAVDEIYYNEDGVKIGENLEISAYVKNNGLYDVEGFAAEITDKNGNILFSEQINSALKVGEETELKIYWPFPNISSVTNYALNITPTNGNDAKTLDNTKSIMIGYSDISVDVEKTMSGNSQGAMITVRNDGRTDEIIELYIYDGDENGSLLGVYSLGTVSTGSLAVYNYTPQKLRFLNPSSDILYFKVVTKSNEKYLADNGGYITYKIAMLDLEDGKQIEYYYDINDDEHFDIRDLVRIKKMLADIPNKETNEDKDINGDEILDSLDLAEIKKKLIDL